MRIEQHIAPNATASNWTCTRTHPAFDAANCHLVLAFAERRVLQSNPPYALLRAKYPHARIVICSTAGQIAQTQIPAQSLVVTAICLEHSSICTVRGAIAVGASSHACGADLVQRLPRDGLRGVLVLSEGSRINGSELLEGIGSVIPPSIPVFGGLAGDEEQFARTLVGLDQDAQEGELVAIGFYGERLQVCHGTCGGWDDFGPMRQVTKSAQNVLYEIDGRPALDLYKEYLGRYADQLPGSALHFPLSLQLCNASADSASTHAGKVVRTILSVDERNSTMTFAGNIPQGSMVRLMKANADTLIDAANLAAKEALQSSACRPELALLVSCVGRRLVLGSRTEEELEVASEVLGEQVVLAGFYSYGEIAPAQQMRSCDLHNQTMTIATLGEC